MIKIDISDRFAKLISTERLPSGNNASITVNFSFREDDGIWKNARRIAIFSALTPAGMRKTLPAIIDDNGNSTVPGKILSTPNSKICAGVYAAYNDGSTVSTNMVFINDTLSGAGGDKIYDGVEMPVDKNDFDKFLQELAFDIDSEILDIKAALADMNRNTGLENITYDEDGQLIINGEKIFSYPYFFHLMSRQSNDFRVEKYWDLLEYVTMKTQVNAQTGETYRTVRRIDLTKDSVDGDTVYVKRSTGNYLRKAEMPELFEFVPELNCVYPFINFVQSELPKPCENEDTSNYYDVCFTKSNGEEFYLSRYFSLDYGTWVVELDFPELPGRFFYCWEDHDILDKNRYTYIVDGEREEYTGCWPYATDVECTVLDVNGEDFDFKGYFLAEFPKKIHPFGKYTFNGANKKWIQKAGAEIAFDFVIAADSWGYDKRCTLVVPGVAPPDYISVWCSDENELTVVNKGYGHFTVEAPEDMDITENTKGYIYIRNTVDRINVFGLEEAL